MNKKTKQLSVTIPKKSLPNNLRYNKDLFFELKAFRKAEGRK